MKRRNFLKAVTLGVLCPKEILEAADPRPILNPDWENAPIEVVFVHGILPANRRKDFVPIIYKRRVLT